MNQPEPRSPGQPPKDNELAGAHIHIRTTMPRKNAYVRAANKAGKPLSEWMQESCDLVAGYKEGIDARPEAK